MPYSWEIQPNQNQPNQPQQSFINKVGSFLGGAVKSISQPLVSGVGSAVRSIEATPKLLDALGDSIVGNTQKATSNLTQANQIMVKPIFGQPTLQGMSSKQALRTAAKTASFLAPEYLAGPIVKGAVGGCLFGVGDSAEHNQHIGQIVASGVVGSVGGAVVGKLLDQIFNGSSAAQDLTNATNSRESVANESVQSMDSILSKVKTYQIDLGKAFANQASQLEQTAPGLRLNLTNEQIDALTALKENKSFALPDYLQKGTSDIRIGSQYVDLGRMNPTLAAQLQQEIAKAGGQTSVSLTPTQTQDLITQLDKSTFRQMANGTLQVDQQRIAITNEIKQAAQQAFGDQWQNIYSRYAQGRSAINAISDFAKIGKNLTATDKNKALQQILKLSETPEGQ